MKTRLLVADASALMYRNYYGRGTANLTTSKYMKSGMFYGCLKSLLGLKERFKESHFLIVFDAGYSGRKEQYPEYKQNKKRTETEKLKSFLRQRNHLEIFLRSVGMQTMTIDGLEADDIISIASYQWNDRHKLNNTMIVSSDRDFFQILTAKTMLADERAGEFYGPDEVLKTTGVKVQDYLRFKCLTGDMGSDNIQGINGIGKVKAAELAATAPLCLNNPKLIEIFWRNYYLMQLPKTFHDMKCIDKRDQDKNTQLMENIFDIFDTGGYLRKEETAQKILDFYECKSLQLKDFYS